MEFYQNYENNQKKLKKIEQNKIEQKAERGIKKAIKPNEIKIEMEKVKVRKWNQNDVIKNEP